ncbi:MAG: sulfotransferase domain-containing protein [Pseudomonadota bacterium]
MGLRARIRDTMPEPVRAFIRPMSSRVLDGFLQMRARGGSADRIRPSFICIGAGKAGTTSLFFWLVQHPDIVEPMKKEINFFYRHWDRGLDFYLAHFPKRAEVGAGAISGDVSPGYLANEVTPQRLAQTFPDAKLIALFRNPVARTISHHHHDVREGRCAARPLVDALIAEGLMIAPERTNALLEALGRGPEPAVPVQKGEAWPPHHMRNSLYADHLERWMEHFPREQFLLLKSEDLFADPKSVYEETLDFIGAEPYDVGPVQAFNVGKYKESDARVIDYLKDVFEEPNERLGRLAGREFDWDD